MQMGTGRKNLLISFLFLTPTIILLFFVDRPIWLFLSNLLPLAVRDAPYVFTYYGLYPFYGIFAFLLIYGWVRKNRPLVLFCWTYAMTQIVFSLLLVRGLKILVGRARPFYGNEFTFFNLDNGFHAFPSGHAADAFVSGVFLYVLLRRSRWAPLRWLPLAYAACMAIARVMMNAHFLSDVIAGSAIGIMGSWYFLTKFLDEEWLSCGRP